MNLLGCALTLFLFVVPIVNGNVIGLDFGSDSMKVAIVQPGTPLEIVSNFQSKRKTPTMISFYKGERLLGSDANAIMGRKPDLTFAKVNRMLGRAINHPLVDEITKKQYFPYNIYTNDTSNATCLKVEDTYYSPEELIAMMMQHAKDMTTNFGGHVIKDCVITVPSSFTQHERTALYTAAEIADLRVLTLIEENTAAALHYGIDRAHTYDTPNTVIYYNMGANSVQVSIVTYSSYVVKEGGKNKTIGQLEVVGKAWDDSLGGFHFDVKLAELLANKFNAIWNKKNHKGDVKLFSRPMTRLRLEATKVKEVLSANNAYPIKAEQLHDNIDLITDVTRLEFEDACDDLFSRLTVPIDKALAMANLSLANIQAVELLGGGLRIPKVKKILDDYFKPSNLELGQHLNGDDAMALGAAFRAANLSTAFRVRKVGLTDLTPFGVSIRLNTLPSDGVANNGFFGLFKGKIESVNENDKDVWQKETSLYEAFSSVPSKAKVVAFPYDKDILCRLEYSNDQQLPIGTDNLIAVYNITGIESFAKESESKGLGTPKVHLSFLLDGNGIVSLTKAEVTVELPLEPEIIEDQIDVNATVEANKSQEGVDTDKDQNTGSNNDTVESGGSNSDASTESTNSNNDKESKSKKVKKDKKKKDNILRRTLTVVENLDATNPTHWSPSMIQESKSRLRILQLADDARKAKEAAMNELETYIYHVKNKLNDDENSLKVVSTEEQRTNVLTIASQLADWLDEEGNKATVKEFKSKQNELKLQAEPIFKRYSEIKDRSTAVNNGSISFIFIACINILT